MVTDHALNYWNARCMVTEGHSESATAMPKDMTYIETLPCGAPIPDLGAGFGRPAGAVAAAGDQLIALNAFAGGQSVAMRNLPKLFAHCPHVEIAKMPGRETLCDIWEYLGYDDKAHGSCSCIAPNPLLPILGFKVVAVFDRPHAMPGLLHRYLLAEAVT